MSLLLRCVLKFNCVIDCKYILWVQKLLHCSLHLNTNIPHSLHSILLSQLTNSMMVRYRTSKSNYLLSCSVLYIFKLFKCLIVICFTIVEPIVCVHTSSIVIYLCHSTCHIYLISELLDFFSFIHKEVSDAIT